MFKQGSRHALVAASRTLLSDNGVNAVEQVSVLGCCTELIVNKSGLERLLWCHDDDGLSGTGADTAKEVVCSAFFREDVLLDVSVGAKSDVVLGNREHQEGAVALV